MKNQINTFKAIASLALVSSVLLSTEANATNVKTNKFYLAHSGDTCLPDARGKVRITPLGNVEVMDVKVEGLPPNTEFDAFVIQIPNKPFGLSWYQGDIQTNDHGKGYARFVGRFNEETFIVAPGDKASVAPVTHAGDADKNPVTAPVHTYHVGIWFNSPEDAANAGCSGATTPFNGEHTAGIQILNTSNFEDLGGPLGPLKLVKP